MEKFVQVLWLISWPVLIYVSYMLVAHFSKKYEKKLEKEQQDNSN